MEIKIAHSLINRVQQMFSIEYFIGFIVLGFILRMLLEEETAVIAIIAITIIWGLGFGFWAVATFFELIIGFAIMQSLSND